MYHDNNRRRHVRKARKLEKHGEFSLSEEQVSQALGSTKPSKALGPDELSPIMLKYLGPTAISYLTKLLNLSLRHQVIPNVWKVGRIIPLVKPGKPASKGKSYRPISLLSPVAKLMEKPILSTLTEHHQHGFREARSTTTALQLLQHHIQDGFNVKRPHARTVLVALDMSRAFDTVNLGILLDKLLQSSLPDHIKRWLSNYLNGRQTYVDFRGTKSKHRKVKQGVPQGGVLSPILFNLYLRDLPQPPEGVNII